MEEGNNLTYSRSTTSRVKSAASFANSSCKSVMLVGWGRRRSSCFSVRDEASLGLRDLKGFRTRHTKPGSFNNTALASSSSKFRQLPATVAGLCRAPYQQIVDALIFGLFESEAVIQRHRRVGLFNMNTDIFSGRCGFGL